MDKSSNVKNWRKNNTAIYVWRADQNDVTYGKLTPVYNQNRKLDVVSDKQQKPTYKSCNELIQEFWSRTTIQGVSQIGSRKSRISKIIWFFIAISGAAMALYQSRDVLQDYYGKSTIQKLSFKSKDAPFPAVTICKTTKPKTTVVDTSSSSDEAMDHDLWLNETYDPRESINYIMKCKFGTVTCNLTDEDYIFPWSNPKYGSCFTFNAGFNSIKTMDIAASLNLVISMTDYPQESELSDFTVILIHQSQTPPSLYTAQYNTINPKDLITVKLKARELIKLVGSTDCMLPDSKEGRKDNIYYSHETPYIFTTLTCQKTCEINKRKRLFKCLDPSSVINATGQDDNAVLGQRYCNYTEISYDIEQEFRKPCICQLACRETLIEETRAQSTTVCKNSNENETGSCAVIKISYGNVPYEIIEEKRKYSDADFWGIIGGNVGLWVGICIISLFEVVELAVDIAISLYKGRMLGRKKPKKISGLANMRKYPLRELDFGSRGRLLGAGKGKKY